ncbi:hypothetical protein PS15p_208907 [Mucor circinelloides]
MNPDYDYSRYKHLRIRLIDSHFNSRDVATNGFLYDANPRHHGSLAADALDPQFMYNQKNIKDVRFGKLAKLHFFQYPVETQYTFVPDFMEYLYKIYKISNDAVIDSAIYKAACEYLYLFHKSKFYGQEDEVSYNTQLVFIVPIEYERDRLFVEDVMRPLLIKAKWVSSTDPKSKLLFFGQLEAALHAQTYYETDYKGKPLEITREKEYLACIAQRSLDSRSVTLQLDIIQMKFDKNYVAASQKSITSSKKQLLAPEFLATSDRIELAAYIPSKALGLPRYILSRICPNSPYRITSIWGDNPIMYFSNDSTPQWFLKHVILGLLEKVLFHPGECVDIEPLKHYPTWEVLNGEERSNLSSINCNEIMQFLPTINLPYLSYWIRSFSNRHQFRIDSADKVIVLAKADLKTARYGSATLLDILFGYLQMNLQNAVYSVYRGERMPYSHNPLNHAVCQSGVVCYLLTMIDLAHTLKEPIVLTSETNSSDLEPFGLRNKTREQDIIKKIPGYGFYVEAKITDSQHIKLYLHRVIETQNGREKSTLPITSTSVEIDDMNDTICDALWCSSQEYSSMECTSSLSVYAHYHNFRSRLLTFLDEMFDSQLPLDSNLHDLQDIHTGDVECSCYVQISHKMILDQGVKSYLKSIARSIISCVKSPATFGNYKVQSVIITGNLLSKWTKLGNTLYQDFIWKQLEEELCLSIYQHQIRVELVMCRDIVEYFSDEKLIILQLYQQVLSQKRILVEIEHFGILSKLYEDKGAYYELIPSVEISGIRHWRFALSSDEQTGSDPLEISKRFYVVFLKDAKGEFIRENPSKSVLYFLETSKYMGHQNILI